MDKIDNDLIITIAKIHYDEMPEITIFESSIYRTVAKLEFEDFTKVIKLNLPNFDSKLKKEIYVYEILKNTEIPIPEIEFFNLSKNKFPDYMIMNFVGDNNLGHIKLSNKKLRNLYEVFGISIGKVHLIKFKEQGRIIDNKIVPENFFESANKSFENSLNNLIKFKALTNLEVQRAKEIHSSFRSSNNAVLCHMDLNPNQVIIDETEKIKGIIDWEWANISEPFYDVSKTELLMTIWEGDFKSFKKGYLKSNSLGNYEDIKTPYLLVHLFHLMSLFKNINDKQNYNFCKKYFDKLISE